MPRTQESELRYLWLLFRVWSDWRFLRICFSQYPSKAHWPISCVQGSSDNGCLGTRIFRKGEGLGAETFHVFGEGESANRLYPQILNAAREGRDLDLTEGKQVRDFMNAEEAARMIHGYAILLSKKHTLQFLEYPIWEQGIQSHFEISPSIYGRKNGEQEH